ncbi:VOC family protein [Leptospira perdikensis]|uniref:VOC family protein n=1 Tax=Leptospira perdikensis TaxID=2484948 RepID=A0A4R9JFA1_9LEPT|nr:VOC family protein [Leptospira perdikensis]TGL37644.1 VOC family protein [Leptospira perdikensis]
MRKVIWVFVLLIVGLSLFSCKKETESTQAESDSEKVGKGMKNAVSIVEIPVSNMERAIKFYQTILNVSIEKMNMEDTELGVIPASENSVNVVLVKGKDYVPTKNGVVIYLNLGDDLQPALDKVEKNGGKILLTKTLISPEMGYYAYISDSEGNKIGMHSAK